MTNTEKDKLLKNLLKSKHLDVIYVHSADSSGKKAAELKLKSLLAKGEECVIVIAK
ncbi:hypothetical protein MCEMSE6_00979 [Oxalobacteraceae bacterium]